MTTTGLLILHTGDGKGKSTAAFGMILRAWGHGLSVGVMQFVKSSNGDWGEVRAARKLGIDWQATGDGFTWLAEDIDATIARARAGWQLAQEKITSGQYDLLVLDEFTYPLSLGWLETGEVLDWLSAHRPPNLHLVITGRNAPRALIDAADLVTEMRLVKHPYQHGVQAQPGVEY